MKCPRCITKDLCKFTHGKIEFDFCSPGCLGVWADAGEVAIYTKSKNDLPSNRDLYEEGKPTQLKCPKCASERLIEIEYIKGKPLRIDICPKCQGIWMDGKELAELKKNATNFGASDKFNEVFQAMKL